MKHTFYMLSAALLIGSSNLSAQETKKDTVRFKLGEYNVQLTPNNEPKSEPGNSGTPSTEKKAKNRKGTAYWSGLDLGMNVITSSQNSFTLDSKVSGFNVNPIKSLTWNLNFLEGYLPLVRNQLGLVTGLGVGYESHSFYSNSELILTKDTAFTQASGVEYSKNKLRTFSGRVPLLLAYNSDRNSKNNFHVAAGIVGNLLMSSVYKLEYEVNNKNEKQKRKTDNPIPIISADAMVRVGFNKFTLFAALPLNPLFRDGTATSNVYSYTFGIQLINFN